LAPAERLEYLQSICKNTRRMAELMEEALLIGSLDAAKTEFKAGSGSSWPRRKSRISYFVT
ncbi:MAG: hypothetical protein WCA06_17340, partial [Terrimicrobiaceae bacterium]